MSHKKPSIAPRRGTRSVTSLARSSAFPLFLFALVSCGASEPEAPAKPPIEERLKEFAARTETYYEFWAKEPLLKARDARIANRNADPQTRIASLLVVSKLELNVGDEAAAVSGLKEAAALLPSLPDEIRPLAARAVFLGLGVASLRLGEVENCCARHTPDSCIMPIRGEGVHTEVRGSTDAVAAFKKTLELVDEGSNEWWTARWLLNVAQMTLGTWPRDIPHKHRLPSDALGGASAFQRFPNVGARAGLGGENLSGGVAAEDFDGDGFVDLVVSNWDPRERLRFYRNQGDGTFVEEGIKAGFAGQLGGLNVLSVDYDSDGDPDVFVLRGAWLRDLGAMPNSLLRNDGGVFTDVSDAVGLTGADYPTQTAAFADYDGDGDLDLYVGNEAEPNAALQFPSQLFRNDGGHFVDVAAKAGVTNLRMAKGVAWGDYDADGKIDLYVSNLGAPNRLYRNLGDGTFVDVAPNLGVAEPIHSFPCWFFDANNDGVLDLYVSAYFGGVAPAARTYFGAASPDELGKLYIGDGKGGFSDQTAAFGLNRAVATMGANFGDLNGDGYPDFYLGTGSPTFDSLMPNVMWLNDGGKKFRDVTEGGGFGVLQKGHGVAFVDYDRDGDQDVFAVVGGAYANDLFQNQLFENPGFDARWASFHLVGRKANRAGYGARIKAEVEEDGVTRSIYAFVGCVGSFGSNPATARLGLGKAKVVKTLEVRWPAPSGLVQTFHDVPVDAAYEIVEGEAELRRVPYAPAKSR